MSVYLSNLKEVFYNAKSVYFVNLIKYSSLAILIFSAFVVYEIHETYLELYNNSFSGNLSMTLIIIGLILMIFKLIYLFVIFKLFLKYKAIESVSDDKLPVTTIIVPAYNEGRQVYDTLVSIAASHFPADKMNVIAIDDGSKDDTWYWILKAKEDLDLRLTVMQQPRNMGKRHALYRAFKKANGEILVTIDSDSIVKKDTLRNLVSPFILHENCGAVAGNVKVLNTEKSIIPKMLNVSFAYSFEFIRAAQSMMGSVLCTPGALAAYKKDAVILCLEDWINQRFWGVKTDIGEDRAMTNMILKQGYQVLFQKNAQVLTNIPENFSSLRKMFTRWERSNVRENIKMSEFAFGNFREGSKIGTRFILINQWIKVLFSIPALLLMISFSLSSPVLYFSMKLLSILILASIPALYYALNYCRSTSILAYSYGIFYAFLLFWITPYAILTAHKRGWLTRGL